MAAAGFEYATFDCYGTLVDWEGGLGAFLYHLAVREGMEEPPPGRELRERWEAIQFEVIQGDYRPYSEVIAESLRRLCDEYGLPYRDGYGEALVSSMGAWQPFPDTRPSLTRAREAGLKLVIVSNTDRAIMRHTLRQLEIDFEQVVVAEDAGAYKPSRAVFEHALERLGADPSQVLHVAFGFKYDIGPASELGLGTAWVNRHRERAPGGVTADHEWPDLWGLAELAAAG